MQIPLVEYEPKLGVTLTGAQRDQLRRIAPSVTVAPTIGVEGAYDLTPGSWIGAIHLDDELELIIRPKLPIERVVFLISYAVGRGRWTDMPAGLERADSVLEAVIPGYIYQLRQALKRGVLQDYQSEEEALATVRGRWRIGDQIREHFGLMPPVEVNYDNYTDDTELNRQLRAAIHVLLRLPLRDDRSRWPLRALDAKLSSVRLARYDPRHIPKATLDRKSERYRSALLLARLILSAASFDLRPGVVGASAFLIDMNKVFEDFVVIALRETLGVSDRVLVQGASGKSLYLDVGERIRLEPDLSMWSGRSCSFVGDVKYKRIRLSAYPNADLYQMTAYTIATGLPGGMLIYAAGEEPAASHEVVHLGKHLELVTLDLNREPGDILRQVAALGDRILQAPAAA